MKKKLSVGLFIFIVVSIGLNAKDIWINGHFTTKGKMLNELTLCEEGKAVVEGIARASYTTEQKGGKLYVTLSSNGKFIFEVSKNSQTLIPVDKFTKEWGTTNPMTLDKSSRAKCNF